MTTPSPYPAIPASSPKRIPWKWSVGVAAVMLIFFGWQWGSRLVQARKLAAGKNWDRRDVPRFARGQNQVSVPSVPGLLRNNDLECQRNSKVSHFPLDLAFLYG
jgi:hypothetical protein